MSNPGQTHTVSELARRVGGTVRGRGDATIIGLNFLQLAGPGDLTFIGDATYAKLWPQSRAAAAIVSEELLAHCEADETRALIVVANADQAMAQLLQAFEPAPPLPELGVHASAVVHPSAVLGAGVRVGPHVTIDARSRIGANVVLHPGVRIYPDVVIGENSVLHANVVVRERCKIGRRALIDQNVSIGADGFGFYRNPNGPEFVKIPHLGDVVIEDDVEIGANTCVDRAKFGSTLIGTGTKIDNLCQIAHNVRIGRHCTLSGRSSISGSVVIGDGVQLAGGAGVADHITIGDGARVGAASIVLRDVPPGATVLGFPAGDAAATKRQWASLKRLPELVRRMNKLLPPEKES